MGRKAAPHGAKEEEVKSFSAGTGAPALQWISPPTRGTFVEGRIFSETARPGKTRHPGFRRRHNLICGADIRNASGIPVGQCMYPRRPSENSTGQGGRVSFLDPLVSRKEPSDTVSVEVCVGFPIRKFLFSKSGTPGAIFQPGLIILPADPHRLPDSDRRDFLMVDPPADRRGIDLQRPGHLGGRNEFGQFSRHGLKALPWAMEEEPSRISLESPCRNRLQSWRR